MGFHAFVRTPGGRSDWYVDPAYNRPGTTAHLSYRSADLPAAAQRRAEGEVEAIRETLTAAEADRSTLPGAQVQRHYYRLALTSDPSYAGYFGTANVLAEKVTLINRVNQIYNDDLATELRLVNDTEKLNLDTYAEATGPDGPCGSAPCFEPFDDNGTPGDDTDDSYGDIELLRRLDAGQEPHRPRSARSVRRTTTWATSPWATTAVVSPTSASSAATTRAAAAPACPSRRATSSPSTTSPTRSATSSPATTPSTAPSVPAAATSRRPRSSRAPARR